MKRETNKFFEHRGRRLYLYLRENWKDFSKATSSLVHPSHLLKNITSAILPTPSSNFSSLLNHSQVIISPILKNNQQYRLLTPTSWRAVLLCTVSESSFPILQSKVHSHHFHWNCSSVSSLHVLKTLSHDSVFSSLDLLIAFDMLDHSLPLEITVFTWLTGHQNLWVFLLLHWSFLLSLSCWLLSSLSTLNIRMSPELSPWTFFFVCLYSFPWWSNGFTCHLYASDSQTFIHSYLMSNFYMSRADLLSKTVPLTVSPFHLMATLTF